MSNIIEFKYEQTENFNVHKNIANNLIPGETILFKLKTFDERDGLYSHLYITNKKICIITDPYRNGQRTFFLNLDDLQGISIRKRTFTYKDSGEIEFISQKIWTYVSKHSSNTIHSRFFYVRNNLSHIIKKIESIIWYYSNIYDRLDRLKNDENVKIPNKFSNFLYNNKIIIPYKKSPKGIEFNQDLYITYYPGGFGSDGKIIFRPSYNSKIKIICKYYKDSLKVLELIYFLSLFWKFKNNSLLAKIDLLELQKELKAKEEQVKNEEKLLDLQKKPVKYKGKHYFDGIPKSSVRSKISEKLYNHYEDYLNKDEKILLYYKEKLLNKYSLLITSLAFVAILSIFLMIYLSWIFIISFLIGLSGMISLPWAFSASFRSCLFTSQKIILKRFKKIGITTYSNIKSITYGIDNKTEDIYFEFNQPIDKNDFYNETSFALRFVPEKLNLYDQIIKLRDQFKNKNE
ncbi:MAG: hypothetical protein ACFFAN_08630 [Promethearchaeota archaeon]